MKKAIILFGLCLIGIPREGHVSSFHYDEVPLTQVIEISKNIVQVVFRESSVKGYDVYDVTSVLAGTAIQPTQTIHGESCILFLTEFRDGAYEAAVWPGYAATSEIPAIQQLLVKK